jgi:GNAT superfamily N-acetyltransferase
MGKSSVYFKDWLVRDYREGDEIEISKLFKIVFKKELSLAFWRWRFKDNPDGVGIIKLLFDRDNLIGHYSVIPRLVQIGKSEKKCAFSMTTMTHPNYQKQGIFTFLAREVYKVCKDVGYNFVYGFPNRNSYHGFVSRLGWKDTVLINKIYKLLKKNRVNLQKNTGDVYEISEFDDDINLFWRRVRDEYRIIVPRTKDYLNWRFVDNPDIDYKKYIFMRKNEVLGYIVLKIYNANRVKGGHIVDILSAKENDVVRDLLVHSYGYFLQNSINYVSCWMQKGYFYNDIFEEEGFIRQEEETWFGHTLLAKEEDISDTNTLNDWYLTMADSDVY